MLGCPPPSDPSFSTPLLSDCPVVADSVGREVAVTGCFLKGQLLCGQRQTAGLVEASRRKQPLLPDGDKQGRPHSGNVWAKLSRKRGWSGLPLLSLCPSPSPGCESPEGPPVPPGLGLPSPVTSLGGVALPWWRWQQLGLTLMPKNPGYASPSASSSLAPPRRLTPSLLAANAQKDLVTWVTWSKWSGDLTPLPLTNLCGSE